MEELTFDILLTALALVVLIFGLFVWKGAPVVLFGGVVALLFAFGVLEAGHLLSAMSNQAVITIFLLIFITGMLRNNFEILSFFDKIYGKAKRTGTFLFGLNTSVSLLSSVINNTPIVALMIPYVYNFSQARGISPSRLLMPMAYAATLGGTITVIGTSTNLVLNGLLAENNLPELTTANFFIIGLAATIVGVLYLSFVAPKLLADRTDPAEAFRKVAREYIVEVKVEEGSPLIGKTVEEAGLRSLGTVFLIELLRDGRMISPVQPRDILQANDLLYFAGAIEEVVDLVKKENGLSLPKTEKFALGDQLDIVEALIPANSNLSGKEVRKSNFRERYDAAIIAIHRDGRRLGGKIGGNILETGDLLLLSAGKEFSNRLAGDKNLYAVSIVNKITPKNKRGKLGFLIGAILGGVALAFGWMDFFKFLILLTLLGLGLGLTSLSGLKREFSPDLYLTLVSSILIGTALIQTGTAGWLTAGMSEWMDQQTPFALLVLIFLLTTALTSFVSNVAAVSVVFPLVIAVVTPMQLPITPFMLALAFGASASFLTPVGYQTNLMVFGPGGYISRDFFKMGLPLTILYAVVCLGLLHLIYF
jgi:di/tricarboxylate transporter